MSVGAFVELSTNNLEESAMPFRMSKTLRFWVEVETEYQDLRAVFKSSRPGRLEGEPANVGPVG